jgi:hypothetical protein
MATFVKGFSGKKQKKEETGLRHGKALILSYELTSPRTISHIWSYPGTENLGACMTSIVDELLHPVREGGWKLYNHRSHWQKQSVAR